MGNLIDNQTITNLDVGAITEAMDAGTMTKEVVLTILRKNGIIDDKMYKVLLVVAHDIAARGKKSK